MNKKEYIIMLTQAINILEEISAELNVEWDGSNLENDFIEMIENNCEEDEDE